MSKMGGIARKIRSGEDLERFLAVARFKGRKIVFTNGCFDILHRGHVEYLSRASELGDLLVVGLNTDRSVRALKGPGRPVQDEQTRSLLLASLSFVNLVTLFDEDTPYDLIRLILPDVLVKGGDYQVTDIVGSDIVRNHGGEVLTIDLTPGFSSTGIIKRMSEKF